MPSNPELMAKLKRLITVTSKRVKTDAAKPKGASMAMRGARGTDFAEKKRFDLINISLNRKSPNQKVAKDVVYILDKARVGRIEPPSGSPDSDHQILTNIANAVLKAHKEKTSVKLNPTQKRVLSHYLELAKRA